MFLRPFGFGIPGTEAKIETLEGELAKTKKRSASHREDFERERGRVDQLMSEPLTAAADLMAARTVTSRLEGEIAALRSVARPADHQPVTPRTPPSAGVAPMHSAPIERRRWWPWRRSTG